MTTPKVDTLEAENAALRELLVQSGLDASRREITPRRKRLFEPSGVVCEFDFPLASLRAIL
jgi:hypothetical protein